MTAQDWITIIVAFLTGGLAGFAGLWRTRGQNQADKQNATASFIDGAAQFTHEILSANQHLQKQLNALDEVNDSLVRDNAHLTAQSATKDATIEMLREQITDLRNRLVASLNEDRLADRIDHLNDHTTRQFELVIARLRAILSVLEHSKMPTNGEKGAQASAQTPTRNYTLEHLLKTPPDDQKGGGSSSEPSSTA